MTSLISPLADRTRPLTFDDMVGQAHLCGPNGILRRIAATGSLPSMVFYGPPGCGKTTAAGILAQTSHKTMYRLNATTASLSDIRDVAKETETMLGASGILLYLDEIQYFNKKQQQSLLEYLEDGRITLIASTTENPYYYIYDALLSRCSVFSFKHVTAEDILHRLEQICSSVYGHIQFEDGVLATLAHSAGGDVRRALTLLEIAANCAADTVVPLSVVKDLVPEGYLSAFDKDGDVHYDLLSCLQKSIRGSDTDAALFYLARLLEGGDMISPCRRLMVIASEDIGPAYPMAAVIVRALVDNARELGLPEARIPLSHAVITLATAPKSNAAEAAIDAAAADVRAGLGMQIPTHLRSPQYKGYAYPHAYPNHWVKQQYLPDDCVGKKYYTFGDNKTEQAAKAYWEKIKGE